VMRPAILPVVMAAFSAGDQILGAWSVMGADTRLPC
jgi:hypothetical protein